MLYYSDRSGHWHLWVPLYGDADLYTCGSRRKALSWPVAEHKYSWLHRLVCRLLLWRLAAHQREEER